MHANEFNTDRIYIAFCGFTRQGDNKYFGSMAIILNGKQTVEIEKIKQ